MQRIARLQRDCLHRQQLLAAGIGRGAIVHRVRTGRYVAVHGAVYLIGPRALDLRTRAIAASLHMRGDALVSHRVAGVVWSAIEDEPDVVELTLVGRNASPQPGVVIHRVPSLHRDDVAWRADLPVTSPARTLVDLAGALGVLELESALAELLQRGLTTRLKILAAVNRAPKRAGTGVLRRLLERSGPSRTRRHYERLLLSLIRMAGLPHPLTNRMLCGHTVDMLWSEERLVVEFDGFKFHGDRRAFENDRRRDQDLVAAGYRVIRVTARQLDSEPYGVVARLAAALAV